MKLYAVTDKYPMLLFSIFVLQKCQCCLYDSGGVCTKAVTQYQLVMNITVGHYRVNNEGDEESIYQQPVVTFLLVSSSLE